MFRPHHVLSVLISGSAGLFLGLARPPWWGWVLAAVIVIPSVYFVEKIGNRRGWGS
ncbi:hypothetical protein [Actinoalloteichus hymeniacidonis]|uniref:Uncharacterized protein n=1 Tax=Actinoalloteichus hymeniacidonis TaxID=340345 RepID=A0AAC9MWE5_9PSEU|nr:hypothetical protein [Actinoalloteichus hymeniacidonis]AOS62128.1 hypothetical protein TL08_06520 [Actinoalloteichus hymeniacidonis]MBB5909850.1 hypothetical protein [Actinoalloteichus hymeniacidonis]